MPTQLTVAEALNQLDQYNSLDELQQLAKIIATDETESNIEIRLKRDAKGQWRVTQNKP